MKKMSLAIYIFFALTISSVSYSQTESHPKPDEPGGNGTVVGTIVCLSEGVVDGTVKLYDKSSDQWDYIDAEVINGEFIFEDVPPGSYTFCFIEQDEVVLIRDVDVNVTKDETVRLDLEIPFVILGKPCSEKLEMGFETYIQMILDQGGGLSMAGADYVNVLYGDCRQESNDEILHSLFWHEELPIQSVRVALAQFDMAFFNAYFPGGTGSAHEPCHSYPIREDFIADLIELVTTLRREESTVSEQNLEDAWRIADDLNDYPDIFEAYYAKWENQDPHFPQYLQDLRDTVEDVIDATEDLPDDAQVAALNFVSEMYSNWIDTIR